MIKSPRHQKSLIALAGEACRVIVLLEDWLGEQRIQPAVGQQTHCTIKGLAADTRWTASSWVRGYYNPPICQLLEPQACRVRVSGSVNKRQACEGIVQAAVGVETCHARADGQHLPIRSRSQEPCPYEID